MMKDPSPDDGATSKIPALRQINTANLPLHCPTADEALWNQHPRVYLPITPGETALCPYCGNRFHLSDHPP